MMFGWTALVLCLLCATATTLVCMYCRAIGEQTGLMDRPDHVRKLHDTDTPLIGGIAVLLPLIITTSAYLWFMHFDRFLFTATTASAALLVLGAWDDRYGVTVARRFLILSFIVLGAFAADPTLVINTLRLELLEVEFSLAALAWPATLLIVVGFVNAVNMADGMNGQLLATVALWSIFLLFYIEPEIAQPYAALAISAAVALVFNLKGRLFSGSAGSYAVSLFIGFSAIALYRRSGGLTVRFRQRSR
jgi:UDP-GlcNAc:undecaprenyl-phosphate GlcNAc-1-phosphate transferase